MFSAGGLGIDVLAGSTGHLVTELHNINSKTNSGTYTTSAVASNVISIDGNISGTGMDPVAQV